MRGRVRGGSEATTETDLDIAEQEASGELSSRIY